MLQRAAAQRSSGRLPSISRAAASPSAIVLAGAGVAVGQLDHLGAALTVVLGLAGYGARVSWAAVRRRLALRGRARRLQDRIDPWSVPEPWRGYVARSLSARRRLRQLLSECPAGMATAHIADALSKAELAVGQLWALAQSGAALTIAPGERERVSRELEDVQSLMASATGAGRAALEGREGSLASELRSLRRTEAVASQVASRLDELSTQLEEVVAAAAGLVAAAGAPGADLGMLASSLGSLQQGLEEARRITAPAPPEPLQ